MAYFFTPMVQQITVCVYALFKCMHYKSLFTVQVSINCYKLNVYSISFLVATPCLGYYSLCKCQFIVLVTINCLIVYTMSV